MAIAAVDTALWDLKARLFDVPLAKLLGMTRGCGTRSTAAAASRPTPTNNSPTQLGGWVHDAGIPRVKMKIGTDRGRRPDRDVERVARARGSDRRRRGTVRRRQRRVHRQASDPTREAVRKIWNVTWFEEPVSSDDLAGLHEVRDAASCDVAAGEYGYDVTYFDRMCAAGAVDVLQADVSRCAGITEWLRVAAVAAARGLEISGHCAQSLHVAPACAVPNLRHLEYFHDHARVDRLLFDGVLDPDGGTLNPNLDRPGMGLELKEPDAAPFLVYQTDGDRSP